MPRASILAPWPALCPSLYNGSLLTEAQRDRIEVVLVSPRNPLNIGAAARAMANFGFPHFAVVTPYQEHWREAKSAVGAPELLRNAKETATLNDAVADCTLAVGTGTLARRKPEQPVVSLLALAPLVQNEIARSGRVALVFGPEKRGLTREDLSFCHLLVEIPTAPRQPSMNLGQAVAVCLYELSAREQKASMGERHAESHPSRKNKDATRVGHPVVRSTDTVTAATGAELERLAEVVERTMLAANYSPAAMREANRHDLRVLLRRLALTGGDAHRILGLFRRILWRLGQ
jgi:TrmH family RNA methyltransferase